MAKEGGNMKIGIIGAGKVGVTLGLYLTEHEVSVTGYYSRTYEHAAKAAEHTKTKAYQNITELLKASDTLFITTPDGEISKVWDCIAGEKLSKKIICHFSGSLSSNVFSGIRAAGACGCSIHPMYAFSDKYTAYRQFHTACLTMEGHPEALDVMSALFGEMDDEGNRTQGGLINSKLRAQLKNALPRMAIGGAIGAVNPVAGALVGAATGVVGGITNAMFGSKLNKERIA